MKMLSFPKGAKNLYYSHLSAEMLTSPLQKEAQNEGIKGKKENQHSIISRKSQKKRIRL
jgi:hypothetical protein